MLIDGRRTSRVAAENVGVGRADCSASGTGERLRYDFAERDNWLRWRIAHRLHADPHLGATGDADAGAGQRIPCWLGISCVQ